MNVGWCGASWLAGVWPESGSGEWRCMVALSKRLGSAVWSGSSFLLGAGAENSGCTHRLSAARSRIREALASWLNIVAGRLAVRRMNQGRRFPRAGPCPSALAAIGIAAHNEPTTVRERWEDN